MTSKELTGEIQRYCKERANADNIIKYKRYFKEGLYDGYGLTAPQVYEGAKQLLKSEGINLPIVLEAAGAMMRHGKSEEISIILLMVKGLYKQYSKETFNAVASWYGSGIRNWAHADTLGMLILPLFIKKDIVVMQDFNSWLKAENKFQRRSVPVTLIKSLKTSENYFDLFHFIECLMTDPEREVHQGTGWFLREAWKRKPAETEEFLLKWKDKAPRLIIQYATEKMTAEDKIRFRRAKMVTGKR